MFGVVWESLTTLGAFVVGVAAGVIVTIRLLRLALEVVRERKKNGDDY